MLSFVQCNDADTVFAVINFSGAARTVSFAEQLFHGSHTDALGGESVELGGATRPQLALWAFRVFVGKPGQRADSLTRLAHFLPLRSEPPSGARCVCRWPPGKSAPGAGSTRHAVCVDRHR